VTTRALISTMV